MDDRVELCLKKMSESSETDVIDEASTSTQGWIIDGALYELSVI